MKRIIFIFFAAMMSTAVCSAAMSNSKVRKETRFLTDKMAYELNLSTEQYNDVYEINYDFISGIRYLMDDVLRGEEWALNRYYDYLDVRNDDLRWVLNNRQYGRFMQAAYFYRPVYVSGGRWSFRVYITYTNHNHFYFPRPYHYRTYCGGHYRTHYHNSYYRGRYHHPHYTGSWSIRNDKSYHTSRRSDSRGRIITVHIAVGIIVRTITTAIIAVVTIIRTIPVRGVFGMISRTTPAAVQISVR